MADQRIANALRDASDTRVVAIDVGAVRSAARLFDACVGDAAAAVVVADETTWALGGEAVDAARRACQRVEVGRRCTVLDLAHEAARLDACVDEPFAPGGFRS